MAKSKVGNIDLGFIGAMSSCLDQYIAGKISSLEVLLILERNLPKGQKNWDPTEEFEGYELIESFLGVKGMTQADLSRETGLSASRINDFIKGRVRIGPKAARKLADAFGVKHTVFL